MTRFVVVVGLFVSGCSTLIGHGEGPRSDAVVVGPDPIDPAPFGVDGAPTPGEDGAPPPGPRPDGAPPPPADALVAGDPGDGGPEPSPDVRSDVPVGDPPPMDPEGDAAPRDARVAPPDGPVPDAQRCTREICNGEDDDCDGLVDEDPAGEGEPCEVAGGTGRCATGRMRCLRRSLVCFPELEPGAEVCNGEDDDCDVEVDEDPRDVRGPCALEDGLGVCAEGTQRCVEGAPVCVGPEPSPEVCDLRDADCDGVVDEGCAADCRDGVPNLTRATDCGRREVHTHLAGCAGTELHVVGVYEPLPRGTPISVTVARRGVPMMLVLSSYEPAEWQLRIEEGVALEGVVLNGHNAHRLVGVPAGVVVVDRSGARGAFASCAYSWPGDEGGCGTQELVAGVEALSGLTLTSFTGCYAGSSFSLGAD